MRRFNFQALGRLRTGEMNKTEKAYSERLERMKQMGEIDWWKFEAVKLRLADKTFYTADFFVMKSGGVLQAHEVKGSKFIFQDDAKVKIKVAAETFPFQFFVAMPGKNKQWEVVEV